MNDKTFLEVKNEEIKKLNVQFLEHLKMTMQLNPLCNKFEFVFKDTQGRTIRNENIGYFTEITTPKAFNYVIFHKFVKDDPFFANCEIFRYENKQGFCILVDEFGILK